MTDSKAIEAAEYAVIGKLEEWEPSEPSALVIAQAAIAAYLAQREADGFVMVPVVPSPIMCEAGLFANENALLMSAGAIDMFNAYRAMIAARPKWGGG